MNPIDSTTPRTLATVLQAEHRRVRDLFRDYGILMSDSHSEADRLGLVSRLGARLHALLCIQEEILYPWLTSHVDAQTLRAASSANQRIARQLQQVAAQVSDAAKIDAAMTELVSLTLVHLSFERERLWGGLADLQDGGLIDRIELRRAELLGEQGSD